MVDKKRLTPSWELVSQSVALVREYFYPFMYLILLPGLLFSLGNILAGQFMTEDGKFILEQQQYLGFAVMGVAGLWTLINLGPMTHFELDAVKGRARTLREYYQRGLRDSLRLFGLYFLMALAIGIGLLLFIIPGLFAMRMLIMSPYYMIDKKLTIMNAIKTSAKASKPVSGAIWGVIGVQLVISFAAIGLSGFEVIGIILGQVLTYGITFILPLRYKTIEH